MKGSVVAVAFCLAGVVCGARRLLPDVLIDGQVSFYVLCLLMLCVGLSVGSDSGVLKNLGRQNPRLLMLPLVTILGTLAGSLAVAWLMPGRTLGECLAVGSGMGYYSLSSILITQSLGAEPGTVALLANVMREIMALLMAPLMARWFGRLSVISAGGATSMDTTLPVISRYAGRQYVPLSVYHGFVTDFSVPFLVSFFCSL